MNDRGLHKWGRVGSAPFGGHGVPVVLAGATHDVREELGQPDALLSDPERQRAMQFRLEGHRDDYVAAHALARVCVGQFLDRPPLSIGIAQRCGVCGAPTHGRPYVMGQPGLHVSWSHTHGYVAAAAAAIPVGVDVESDRRAVDPGLYATVLTDAEERTVRAAPRPQAAFLRQWVRKECLVKLGRATLGTLHRVDVSWPVQISDQQWRAWSLGLHGLDWSDAEHGVVGAVCADFSAVAVAGGVEGSA